MENMVASLELESGATVLVEVVSLSDEMDVALSDLKMPFEKVSRLIVDVADGLNAGIDKVRPDKATVEFGVTVGAESGHLAALIAKGTGEANLTVTLEWL